MKKLVITVLAVTTLAILGGVWAYLFFNGSPESIDEVFSDFRTPNNTSSEVVNLQPNDTDDITVPETEPTLPALRQLTTTPVAGFIFYNKPSKQTGTTTASTTTLVRYAEKGTGYVYEIDPQTGERSRISSRTIPNTREAHFTKNGKYATLLSGNSAETKITILEFTSATTTESAFLNEVSVVGDNFSITNDEHIFYTTIEDNRATGKALHLASQTKQTIFTLPYVDTEVEWGISLNGSHYVYQKPQTNLIGYLYKIEGDDIIRLPISGYELSVLVDDDFIVYSSINNPKDNTERTNVAYNISDNTQISLATQIVNEKCTYSSANNSKLWCGSDITDETTPIVEWYTGTNTYSDDIWFLDLNTGSSRMVVNIQNESGREVDIDKLIAHKTDSMLIFRNRNNGTLWLYETQ